MNNLQKKTDLKKKYTVNPSVNLRGNVGNILDVRWNFIPIQCDFDSKETGVLLYKIYKIRCYHLRTGELERRMNTSLPSHQLEVNFQPGFINLFFADEQMFFLWKISLLDESLLQKVSIDSLPSERIFSQIYVYRYLSMVQY